MKYGVRKNDDYLNAELINAYRYLRHINSMFSAHLESMKKYKEAASFKHCICVLFVIEYSYDVVDNIRFKPVIDHEFFMNIRFRKPWAVAL